MAKQPNYGFEKRKKEQDRKQKKEAKKARRLEEAKQSADAPAEDSNEEPTAGDAEA